MPEVNPESPATALQDIDYVLEKLQWMEHEKIWPNGLRYLWTDAFGLVLYLSLYKKTGDQKYLSQSTWLVNEVYRVLGRHLGIRIGEEADRDGQYFHYLAMWLFALQRFGEIRPQYTTLALDLVKQIHPRFVIPHRGVIWKMTEDLGAPYPGYGLGSMDAFDGYVSYKLLAADQLEDEIRDMRAIMDSTYRTLIIDQDLGAGMMLWLSHFFPRESWAEHQRVRCIEQLQHLWIEPPGYFCRQLGATHTKFAFTNYGISLGLQSVDLWPERVEQLNAFFDQYVSHDEYDRNAITHVMACTSHFPGLFTRARIL